jgi:hypothetical protein
LRAGEVLLDEEMVPREELLASRFYREFLSTIGIGRVCVGIVFEGSPGLPATMLPVFRDAHEPAFERADVQWMKLLVPHVSPRRDAAERPWSRREPVHRSGSGNPTAGRPFR